MEVFSHIRCMAGSLWKVVRGKLDGSSPHNRCMADSLWKVVRGKLDGSFLSYSLCGRQPMEGGEG
jgi:hypothetical protein